jgi:hypothetical protein
MRPSALHHCHISSLPHASLPLTLQTRTLPPPLCQPPAADVYMIDEPSSYLDVRQRLKAAEVRGKGRQGAAGSGGV